MTKAMIGAVSLMALSALLGCKDAPKGPPVPGTLVVRITDGPGGPPMPGRVVLLDGEQPMRAGELDMYKARQAKRFCRIADGAIATWDGLLVWRGAAEVPVGIDGCKPTPAIRFGRHRVLAWRGLEHERWEGEVELAPGRRTELVIPLERAFRVEGAVTSDLHVHADDSGDSTVPDDVRVIAMMASGIQVVGIADHNWNGDGKAAIAKLGVGAQVASIASNELGNDGAHFGVYPVPIDRGRPRGGSPDQEIARWTPAQMMAWGRAIPGALVQVNHPRFRMYALFDGSRWDGVAWPPPFSLDFDTVEIINGHTAFNAPGDRRSDEAARDLYTLVGHGALKTAVGNSDVHHLNGVRDGLARSYVYMKDTRLEPFDEAGFVAALRGRRAVATTGPWLALRVSGVGAAGPGQAVTATGGQVVVEVELSQARWCHATEIRVRVGKAGGGHDIVQRVPVPAGQRTTRARLTVPVTADTWIGADASGDEPLPVDMTGTYQIEKKRPGVVPFAIVNPVLIDADGDGRVRYEAADVAVGAAD